MNWAIGFRELGWDVWIAEHLSVDELEPPEAGGLASPQEEHWHATAKEFGFEGRECLIIDGASPQLEAFRDFAATADLFINYSGQFKRLDLLGPATVKAYLDVDPAFTQLWVEVCKSDMNLDGHDVFLTVGTTLDRGSALVPSLGRQWIPTAPPVVADFWRRKLGRAPARPADAPWTTIAHWYGYHELEWEGRKYSGKRESLMDMRLLPTLVAQTCGIATDLQPDWHDYDDFSAGGWKFYSGAEVSRSVDAYLQFIAASRGELGIAKTGYIVSRGGWNSDRSVVYLALGCPVLLHDTGWPAAFPLTAGMVPFRDTADCAAGIVRIEEDYANQSHAARELSDTVFSAGEVLRKVIARVL